ncbi:MAG: hypothetical protein JW874_07450 [Spirochaetales bacterium]|nr:hypothetical protein [Spirochaetales bacterium]
MKNNRIIRIIGNRIVDGPIALYPPDSGHGWYEQDLCIRTAITDTVDDIKQITGHESVSVWTDGTMNRDSGFFSPVIRLSRWYLTDSRTNMQEAGMATWPDVTVNLGGIAEPEILNSEIYRFQEGFRRLPWLPMGLCTHREVPDFEPDSEHACYTIFCRNGLQSIEISGESIARDSFSRNVFRLCSVIKNNIALFDKSGWREKYHIDFKTLSGQDFYYWNYSAHPGS